MPADLVAILNKLGEEANSMFPQLNWGGCCVYAGMVATALEERGYPAQGRVAGWSAGMHGAANISEVRKKVKHNTSAEWNENGINFGHVGIEFYDGTDVYLYDSNGCTNPDNLLDGMHSFEGRLTAAEMTELWQNNGPLNGYEMSWNPSFDRKLIPSVQKLVNKHFRKIPAVA